MTRKHGIIPDTQAKPGVPLNHMPWVGDYFAEKKPDVIVHVGDHWDMPSLSHYDKGTMAAEGRAYLDDIKAGNMAMDLLMGPIRREQRRQLRHCVPGSGDSLVWYRRRSGHRGFHVGGPELLPPSHRQLRHIQRSAWRKLDRATRAYITRCLEAGRALPAEAKVAAVLDGYLWNPRLVFCIGNHEQRIMRHVNANPELRRTLGYHSFNLEAHGWEVHDFLHAVKIDGVSYQHYVPQPNTGRPWGGMAEPRLKSIGYSFTSGHEQGKKAGERYLQNETVQRALVVGSCYLHNEEYKGPQGNHHWRGIVLKHEVAKGNYDLMEVSLTYLRRRYVEKYPHASRETIRYVP